LPVEILQQQAQRFPSKSVAIPHRPDAAGKAGTHSHDFVRSSRPNARAIRMDKTPNDAALKLFDQRRYETLSRH
jgi:hypothetical protein